MSGTDRVLEALKKIGITQFAERNIRTQRASGTHSVFVPLDMPLEQLLLRILERELPNIRVSLEHS